MGLAYTSIQSGNLLVAGRQALVAAARPKNERLDISTVLLCCNRGFMQYLEGPEQTLLPVFNAIASDSRHHGLVEMFRAPIAGREFGNWPMHYKDSEDPDINALDVASWLRPQQAHAEPGRVLLSHFWKNNRLLSTHGTTLPRHGDAGGQRQ